MIGVTGTTSHGSDTVLRLSGELTERQGAVLDELIVDQLATGDACTVVVDLASITYLPSRALGALVIAGRDLERSGRRLVLRAPQDSIAAAALRACCIPFESSSPSAVATRR